jgi:catechol 2,3-dioxygenase-like lactoylglutathione lyase family enzyme
MDSTMAHLFRVIVPGGDIERAAGFYRRLLGSPGRRVSPGRHYFDCEGTILACYDPQADGDERGAVPRPEPLYIAVDDLDATYAAARAAGASLSPDVVPEVGPLGQIAGRPWGEQSFYAADPFDNPLCFVARRTVFTGMEGGDPSA